MQHHTYQATSPNIVKVCMAANARIILYHGNSKFWCRRATGKPLTLLERAPQKLIKRPSLRGSSLKQIWNVLDVCMEKSKLCQPPLIVLFQRKRLTWVGYVIRMAPARLPRRRLFWEPLGRRRPQRQRMRWRDTLARELPIISVSLMKHGGQGFMTDRNGRGLLRRYVVHSLHHRNEWYNVIILHYRLHKNRDINVYLTYAKWIVASGILRNISVVADCWS